MHDLAREVRYRVFDRPLLLAARERIYAAAESDLAAPGGRPRPGGTSRGAIRALVDCTQPLHRILSQRFASAGPGPAGGHAGDHGAALLPHPRAAAGSRASASTGRPSPSPATSTGARTSTSSPPTPAYDACAASLETVRRLAGEAAAGAEIVADLYFWSRASPGRGRGRRRDRRAAGGAWLAAGSPGLRRVAVSLSGRQAQLHLPPRADGRRGFREEQVYRGIHPMIALRLQLWRLRNFHLERLPAPDGVFLFHGVAHENPGTSGCSPSPRCAT